MFKFWNSNTEKTKKKFNLKCPFFLLCISGTLCLKKGNKEMKFKSKSSKKQNKTNVGVHCLFIWYFTSAKRKETIQSDVTWWVIKSTRLVSVVLHCRRCLTEHWAGWSVFFVLIPLMLRPISNSQIRKKRYLQLKYLAHVDKVADVMKNIFLAKMPWKFSTF